MKPLRSLNRMDISQNFDNSVISDSFINTEIGEGQKQIPIVTPEQNKSAELFAGLLAEQQPENSALTNTPDQQEQFTDMGSLFQNRNMDPKPASGLVSETQQPHPNLEYSPDSHTSANDMGSLFQNRNMDPKPASGLVSETQQQHPNPEFSPDQHMSANNMGSLFQNRNIDHKPASGFVAEPLEPHKKDAGLTEPFGQPKPVPDETGSHSEKPFTDVKNEFNSTHDYSKKLAGDEHHQGNFTTGESKQFQKESQTSESFPKDAYMNKEKDSFQDKKTSPDEPQVTVLPSGEGILKTMQPQSETKTAEVTKNEPVSNLSEIAREVAESILVSDASLNKNQEVRIQLKESVLPGTEIHISWEGEQIRIELVSTSPDSFRQLENMQNDLGHYLQQKLEDKVEIHVQFNDTSSGGDNEGRSRQQRNLYEEMEDK